MRRGPAIVPVGLAHGHADASVASFDPWLSCSPGPASHLPPAESTQSLSGRDEAATILQLLGRVALHATGNSLRSNVDRS